jgi:membrane peptidoglycan carboxypeptidase
MRENIYIKNQYRILFVAFIYEAEWRKLKLCLRSVIINCNNSAIGQPPAHMQALLIAGEDHRFEYHPGVDPIALLRAIWRTCLCGRREGGSTIAMQLVRILSGRYEKTLSRKFREICLALRLSRIVPKEELPVLYLSIAYYGWKMNGFIQACGHLNLNPESLTLVDAAKLVARLKYPQPRNVSVKRYSQIIKRSVYLLNRYDKAPIVISLK